MELVYESEFIRFKKDILTRFEAQARIWLSHRKACILACGQLQFLRVWSTIIFMKSPSSSDLKAMLMA